MKEKFASSWTKSITQSGSEKSRLTWSPVIAAGKRARRFLPDRLASDFGRNSFIQVRSAQLDLNQHDSSKGSHDKRHLIAYPALPG
jgi:hypothetical protein